MLCAERRGVMPARLAGHRAAVAVAAAVTVAVLVVVSRQAVRVDALEGIDLGAETSKIESALSSIDHKLAGVAVAAPSSQLVGDGREARPLHAEPGHEWNAADEQSYQDSMAEATGSAGTTAAEKGVPLPTAFMPIDDPGMRKQYAKNLVDVLRNLKAGYLDEMVQWAEKGPTAENSYIAPIVEGIEAPLIKDLDAEAHERVKKTVAAIGLKKNLNAEQMKEMRARLLVPLLLRIRARVHHKCELYTVSMLRRVILGAAEGKDVKVATMGIATPSTGGDEQKPTHDMQMEYQLRDIDTLYTKGVISEKDYEAEKAKILSEWLGLAVKQIGGKGPARAALENFLWPAVMTEHGCRCLLPFKYHVTIDGTAASGRIHTELITYDECTDIGSPGSSWCAIDPADSYCMKNQRGYPSKDRSPNMGWSRWDKCAHQPKKLRPGSVPKRDVITERGCKCILPFEIYPPELGGLQKVELSHCTRLLGQKADWCVVQKGCGHKGLPGYPGGSDSRLGNTYWDRCVGEPAGFLEPTFKPIPTVKGCECRRTWEYEPEYMDSRVSYSGCTDIESPGTAWCAVMGNTCGTVSLDPASGWGKGKYGWKRWDVCNPQPDKVMVDLRDHILPSPVPYVRTEQGCQCKLPWRFNSAETDNQDVTFYTCQRLGLQGANVGHAAWCPTVGDCGHKATAAGAIDIGDGDTHFGWTHWDLCIGEPAGFLAPPKPKVYTRGGCVCKQPWPYRSHELGLEEYFFKACTDIESPNDAWCAVDPVESPNCGTASTDVMAGLGEDKYGWVNWDYCEKQNPTHDTDVVPYPAVEVKTLQGCTCKIPYKIKPPALGFEEVTLTHCNRYDEDLADDADGSGLSSFYWCLVNEPECGYSGKDGQWDKCVGVPSGYLEPTPMKTVQGCDCIFPFEYQPPTLAQDAPGQTNFVFTEPTDINQHSLAHQKTPGAWCAVVGQCGHTSTDPRAHYGPGGFGWTNWDVVLPAEQPEERELLTGDDVAEEQRALPKVVPRVRTLRGCTCKLPWAYEPSSTCAVTEEDAEVCEGKGGYMMQGWCVTCDEKQYTMCTRDDQEAAWCAVEEDDCGTASSDAKALDGTYGWTHWDYCIGQPAGYMPPPSQSDEETAPGATLAQKHGVSVESVVMEKQHGVESKVLAGGDKTGSSAGMSLIEAKKAAVKKIVHKTKSGAKKQAVAAPQGPASSTKTAGSQQVARGRGTFGSDDGATNADIKKLASRMEKSIDTLNHKIQKLDEAEEGVGSVLRASSRFAVLFAVIVALLGGTITA